MTVGVLTVGVTKLIKNYTLFKKHEGSGFYIF